MANTVDNNIATFATEVRGDVLRRGDAGYDDARRVWNGMIDRHPALIVRCSGTADVIACVNFARENKLLLSIKGGGHSFAGSAVCDDGLMIDLSRMRTVRVDPAARTARVQGGATWADFDHETQAFGLATTGGLVSSTGVAGLTLGGGLGYLTRRLGLAIDNLISADVVIADGTLVHASKDENADLFWGLRGGGGNFGVVVWFEFALHPIGPELLAGPIFHPFEAAADGFRFYRDFMRTAPDDVACYAMIVRVPPVAPFPEAHHGKPALALVACYAGDPAEGEAALRPLREFGKPLLDGVARVPYTALQQSFDAGAGPGNRWYTKSRFLGALTDDAIDTIMRFIDPLPGPLTQVGIESLGGAMNRVPSDATAFPHRDAAYAIGIWPASSEPGDDHSLMKWAREFHDAMAPHAQAGVYVNYLDADEAERVGNAYGDHFERLGALKRKWDPNNLFRVNQNIRPKD
jgi:FAD/FMN-containing dehydrogenase